MIKCIYLSGYDIGLLFVDYTKKCATAVWYMYLTLHEVLCVSMETVSRETCINY